MNSIMFEKEVLSSKLCPKNFKKIYVDFQKYQNLAIKTLNEIHYICIKNNIEYQLAYGSLLGAVRDNGQIPWDYDIDIFVPFCKKDKLIGAFNNDLSQEYYYYSPENDKKCRHYLTRVTPKNYRSEVLHVDIFYVIGVPDDDKKRYKFQKKMVFLNKIRRFKLLNAREHSYGDMKRYISLIFLKMVLFFLPINILDKVFYKNCNKYDFYNSKYCAAFTNNIYYDRKKMWDTFELKTMIGNFMISKNYRQILKKSYGNYNEILSLDSRLKEMLTNYNHLKIYESYKKY